MLARILFRLAPFIVLVGGLILSGFVLIWAKDIGILIFKIPEDSSFGYPGQQVGFAFAWNWSVNLILFPVSACLTILAVQRARRALVDMHKAKMLLDNDFQPISEMTRDKIWNWVAVASAILAAVLAALLMKFAVDQYYEVAGDHLLAGRFLHGVSKATSVHEFDWSVAALIDPGGNISIAENERFGRFVYIFYFGLYLGMVFALFAFLAVLAAAASLTMFERPGIRIVPNPESEDTRRGFEALEDLFVLTVIITFLAFFAAYLVHLQNIYLRVDQPTFWAFFFGSVQDAYRLWQEEDGQSVVNFISVALGFAMSGEVEFGEDSVLTSLAGVLVFALFLILVRLMLHFVAKHGKAVLDDHLGRNTDHMVTWPVGWPKVATLSFGLFLAVLSLFFYRLGIILFLGAVAMSVYRLYKSAKTPAPS